MAKGKYRNFTKQDSDQGEKMSENNQDETVEAIVDNSEKIEDVAEKDITSAQSNQFEQQILQIEQQQQSNEDNVVSNTTSPTNQQEGFIPVYKVELELTGYADAMDKNKSIVPEEGGKWQYSLFNTIKSIFNAKDQEEFNKEFNTILNFFNKNKNGIFNEKFIYRFPANWVGSSTEFTFFRRIVYLIIQTADPKDRKKVVEHINLETVVEGLSEAQKQKLFNFYLM